MTKAEIRKRMKEIERIIGGMARTAQFLSKEQLEPYERLAEEYNGLEVALDTSLTSRESAIIESLQALATAWPDTLWLYSAGGTLCVMKKKSKAHAVTETGGVDQRYVVATIEIENDGGDW